jgi:two-component system, sensor histidine kinase
VLIVDDSVDSADLLELLLQRSGYETRVVRSSSEAVAAALDFLPHVALIDIGLPGMDGVQLLSLMRAEAALGACRFVAVTGYSIEDLECRTEAASFHAHLRKPIDFDALYRVVGTACQIDAVGTGTR